MKKNAFLLFALCFSFQLLSQSTKIPIDPNVTIGKLKNGLTYYIRKNKKPEQKVELRLVVNAGSILEDDDQQGLAHMCEHMAFNGTKNFKKNELVSFLQSIGVSFGNDLNAYTSYDETVYILPIPTDKPTNIEKGFQILEDWAHNVTYLDSDIDGERGIILEESRTRKGAFDRFNKKITPVLLAGSQYAKRQPIGLDSIISNFKYESIRRFYNDWYRPDLMAVIVVGDIEVPAAQAMIESHFAALTNPANERPRKKFGIDAYNSNSALILTDAEATNYGATLAYSASKKEEATTLSEYKNDITKSLFTTIINQRLQELTQKENPPFLGAQAYFGSQIRNYEAFQARSVTVTGDATKSLTSVIEEIEKVKRFGFTQTELDRAKTNILTSFERATKEKDKTESDSYVGEYIRHFLSNEAMPGIETEYQYHKDLVPTITLEDVNAIANPLKSKLNYVAYLTGPEKNKDKLPNNFELLNTINSTVTKPDIIAYEEKAVSTTLFNKKLKAGKILSTTTDPKLQTTIYTLSNGIKVTVKKTDFKNDEILMSARRFGGTNNYGLNDKYNAAFLTQIIGSMGVGEFSPTDLKKALTGKSLSLRPSFGEATEGFSGNSSVKDFESLLQLLNLHVYEPRVDSALFRSFIQKSKSQTTFMMSNPQTYFIDTMLNTSYKNNPLAPISIPKSEYYDKISLNRVMEIYATHFGDMSGMHFTFVGSIPDNFPQLLEKYIGSLPVSNTVFRYKDNGVRPYGDNTLLNVQRGKDEKAMIIVQYNGETPYSEDLNLKARAIAEVLNIKIIEELREKIQGIYGGRISVGVSQYPYNNYSCFAMLPCGPVKVDTLLQAFNAEVENIKTNGPSVENLNKVKQQWLEQMKTSMKENRYWLQKLESFDVEGADPDRFLNYEKYVQALTPNDLKTTSNLIFNKKNTMTAVLRPEAK